MIAFVTGATGFLGRHLVQELAACHRHVRALVRNTAKAGVLPADVEPVRGCLEDESVLREALQGVDVVFHLGAAIGGSWEDHERVTVQGTRRLLELARECGVRRFVHVSSLAVYDKRGLAPGAPVDEDWRLVPDEPASGPYARGKVQAEAAANEARAAGLDVVIMRPGLIFGPDHIIFPHLGELFGSRRIAFGGRGLLLPMIDVDSVVDALVRMADSEPARNGTYHLVDVNDCTRAHWLAALRDVAGWEQPVQYVPVAPVVAACGLVAKLRRLPGLKKLPDVSAEKIRVRAVEACYDTTRLERDTGWRPRPDIRRGLRKHLGLAVPRQPVRIERVGLIGAGAIAPAHVEALRRLRGVQIVGILDKNLTAARSLAEVAGKTLGSPPLPAFDDAERFYREAQPQAVHVLTPPQTHAAVARDALERGMHVLLEKPAVTSLVQCDALLAAARIRGLTVGVDENYACDPLVQRAFSMIHTGVTGELVHVSVFMSYDLRRTRQLWTPSGSPAADGGGFWALKMPGGLLEDLLPHPLSVAVALAGTGLELVDHRVMSTGRTPFAFPDELRMHCVHGKTTVDVALSLNARPDDFLVTVHGTRATLRMDLNNMLLDAITPVPGPRAVGRGVRTVRSGSRNVLQTAGNFLRIATKRGLPPNSPANVIQAHYEALATGRELPAPLSRARTSIALIRAVWPLPVSLAASARVSSRGE
jgi:nucleoside-diphosphate-sugar epimerase/predicted dehydrogenase